MKDKDKFSSNLGVLWLDISDSTGNTQSSLNWEIYEITNISYSTNAKLITDLPSFKHLRGWVWSASFQLGWILRCKNQGLGQEEPQIFSWHVSLVTCSVSTPSIPFFVPQVGGKDTGGALGSVTGREEAQPCTKGLGNSGIIRNTMLMDFLFISDSSWHL